MYKREGLIAAGVFRKKYKYIHILPKKYFLTIHVNRMVSLI